MKRLPSHDPPPPSREGGASEGGYVPALRGRAATTGKTRVALPSENLAGLSTAEMQRIIHELRVQQIEVEAQNEELQRQQAELAAAASQNAHLKESLRVKSLAFDLAINAISIANPEGLIAEANPAFLRMWGYASKDEVIGQPIPHFIQNPQNAAAILVTLNDKGCWEGSFDAKRKDGSSFIAFGQATVMRNEVGRAIGYQSSVLDITERRQMDAAMDKIRSLLAETERIGKVGGWDFDIKNNRLTWTEEIYRIHGVDPTFEPTVHDAINFYTPASRPAIVRAVQRAIDFGEPFDVELELITANGELKPVHSIGRADLAQGRIFGFFQDITAQKQAERTLLEWNQTLEDRVAERTRELQLSETRFRHLAETTFEGIAISQSGKLIDGNARLGEIHGYELAEMIGRPIADFVAPESHAKVTESIRSGEEVTYEFLGLRRDGSTFPVEAHGRSGSWHGTASRISALRDLTESKRLAARLQTQQTALEHAQRLALITEVCAGIVHQISQPLCAMEINLAVIQGRLGAAADTSDETLEILKDIIKSVASIREIIHHLRALLQTERSHHLPTDCHRLLAESLPLLRQEAEHRGIRLAVELGPDLPPVLADPVQLTQVLLILARNAFDACAAGPPDRRMVVITTRATADPAVEWIVRDSGTGIAPEVIGGLFAPFFTTKAGMGIGLRLSRTIVEAHGGRIEASNNTDGIGATFRVILPGLPPASPA